MLDLYQLFNQRLTQVDKFHFLAIFMKTLKFQNLDFHLSALFLSKV